MKKITSSILFLFLIIGIGNAQKIDNKFFESVDQFLKKHVSNNLVNYESAAKDDQLNQLIKTIEAADLSSESDMTKKAFYINAYNLNVIHQVIQSYPTTSPQDIGGFFDKSRIRVAGKKMSLNTLEKSKLLKPYKDPRFHFVLVCGAVGCPPIINSAYTPENLEALLDQQSSLAVNSPSFTIVNDNSVQLSQIFKWYSHDFGGSKSKILDFINSYRTNPISKDSKVSYYQYNWTLNDSQMLKSKTKVESSGANSSRYIVSSTIRKGSIEAKFFNNLYSQKTGNKDNLTDRSSFFTTSLSFLYGLNDRLNIGFSTRFRKVRNQSLPSSAFEVFGSDEFGSSRSGLTAFGPQIRYAPVPSWENFSIQSSFVLPIGNDLAGSDSQPYIDWTGATWNTQFFNDLAIGTNFSLFTEIDLLLEDIGSSSKGHSNRFSTPATLIFSYNPNPKTTIYTLGGFSPYWQATFDYFIQAGIGTKYQFTSKLELELLYTKFTNKFLLDTGGQAATYNVGLRFNI